MKLQGLSQLAIEIIELVADELHTADEENKVSSSSLRKRLLGTLIRSPLKVYFIYHCLELHRLFEFLLKLVRILPNKNCLVA